MSDDMLGRLRMRLADDGLGASAWSNGPGDRYGSHRHDYDKVLVAADGSIEFQLPELRRAASLAPGDRLDLPAGTLHGALVGPMGVTCLEAHLPAGSLPAGLREIVGWGLLDHDVPSERTNDVDAVETGPVGAA